MFGQLAIDPAAVVGYREEVHHPALDAPETASGTMHVAADGRLVKSQERPRSEISEIGAEFLSLRPGPDAGASLLPIPPEARPVLDALRATLSGDFGTLTARFAPALLAGGPLWRVRLAVHGAPDALPVVLIGCGAALRGIEIHEPGGIRRLIVFGSMQ